jgi:histone-lysine N-methyltransferase SETMAR
MAVIGNYYVTILTTEIMAAIRRKRPHLLMSGFILHHDNAPSHSSHVVMDTLEKLGFELLPHRPYSPDLAICEFWLFSTLRKNSPRGTKFESREELRCFVDRQLREMSRDGLQHVVESWVERWDKCKSCMGRYFKKE